MSTIIHLNTNMKNGLILYRCTANTHVNVLVMKAFVDGFAYTIDVRDNNLYVGNLRRNSFLLTIHPHAKKKKHALFRLEVPKRT